MVKAMKKIIFPEALLFLVLAAPVPAAEPVPVKAAAFSQLAVHPQRSAPAVTLTLNDAPIAAQIAARIEAIPVRVGDVAGKGQLLVKLDCADYQLNRRQTQARLAALDARIELAGRKLERTRGLTKHQAVSEEILDEREADLKVLQADRMAAQAELETAKLNESRCTIHSPYQAVVTRRAAAEGQYASPGTVLVQIMDISDPEVSAQVFSGDVEQISADTGLYFEFVGKRHPVTLRAIVPAINSETRNREVRLVFKDQPALPGAAGKLVWRDPRAHVPGNLLLERGGVLGVFIVNDSHGKFFPLPSAQAGRASPADLPETANIVTEGRYALQDGDAVVVTE